jgi:hypothetical protein
VATAASENRLKAWSGVTTWERVMKNMTLGAFAFACAVALATTGADKLANATTITETIDFTGSDFTPSAPIDPVIGAFTITLDPTISITGGTTVTLDNVNITPSTIAPFFDYHATVAGGFLMSAPRVMLLSAQ